MEINIFEIIVMMINFFILMFLLQKLFYKPITKAMEERRESITREKNEVKTKMKEANDLIETYNEKISNIDNYEKETIDKAEKEAEDRKEKLIKEYSKEAKHKRQLFIEEIQEERESFLRELRKTLGINSVKIASQILSIISMEDLKLKVLDSFIKKVLEMDEDKLCEEVSHDYQIQLVSGEEMTDEMKDYFQEKISEKVNKNISIQYEINRDLILGYELKLNTLNVQMNIEKYLKEAENNINKLLDKEFS